MEIRIRCKTYWNPLCLQLGDGPAKIARLMLHGAGLPRGQCWPGTIQHPGTLRQRRSKAQQPFVARSAPRGTPLVRWVPPSSTQCLFHRGMENPLAESISASRRDLSASKNAPSVKYSLLINSSGWCWRPPLPWLFILCYSVSATDKRHCRSFKPYFSKWNVHSAAKLVFVINNI